MTGGRLATAVTNVTSPTLLLAVLYPVVGALAAGPAGVAWSLVGIVFMAQEGLTLGRVRVLARRAAGRHPGDRATALWVPA